MESTSSIPFRSKKPALHTTPKKAAKPSTAVDGTALASPTPEKSNRIRNRNVALSRKDVRKKVLSLQQREQEASNLGSSAGRSGRESGGKESAAQGMATRSGSGGSMAKNSVKLPEKFEILCEFFKSLVAIIRLTRMRRKTPTFTTISSKIESLMGRRFTISHLAQLKHVIPEALEVKKIRTRDEATECIQEDLNITLDGGALGPDMFDKDWSNIFRSRVEDYLKSHSEEEDIPKGELPALFYQPKQENKPSAVVDKPSITRAASHISPCFQGSFLRKASTLRKVEEASSFHLIPSTLVEIPPFSAKNNEIDCSAVLKDESLTSSVQRSPLMSPAGKTFCTVTKDSDNLNATPLKDASTPARLMVSTPMPQGSKRPMMSPIDDESEAPAKLVRRAQRSRTLKFDQQEEKEVAPIEKQHDQPTTTDSDLDFLGENLLQSLREKEVKRIEALDPAISQAKRRRQLMGGLTKLFDSICLLFQSINRTVIPKHELLNRTGTNHSDKGEVEEKLKLLLELAPEFLSETKASRGDTLIRLNNSADVQAVRTKLLNAE